ncbi:hemoglobin/transferrin/lactoferrin receptor protein [Pseudorhodoplanes sinuspersici]|nr:TonB-dependent receptor [Pseudorhodoplanes sinuspersici]RKE69355.1 hemoglobin/transferrin/lactoferrin receptor protein [Pseudorhodoplanes sinuspersici]
MRKKRELAIALLTSTALLVISTSGSPAFAQSRLAALASFNIQPQPLSQALIQFSGVTGIQLFFSANLVRGLNSPGVQGSFSQTEALSRLLAGSGLTYSFTNATTVTISKPGLDANAQSTVDGAIQLDVINVSGGRTPLADVPYQTPGSVSYISEEAIQRFPGRSAGDIFQGTPGVISGMNRNGAAIDPNIRGLQGMNRVATTIDGSEQSTSSYRGYSGVDNRSYVDPDLISGVTITKGPNDGSAGAIGGTVAIETLKPADILKPGDTYGVRLKTSVSSNGIEPRIGATTPTPGPPSDFNFSNRTGSAAFAVTQPNIDLVGAYVRRIAGNYFAGTHGPLYTDNFRGGTKALSPFKYGDEVFNTSQNSSSALLKATLRPADGHELQLGYMRYENKFGEVLPTVLAGSSVFTRAQLKLSTAAVDQFTARYHFKPADNNLIDLKANAWMSGTDEVASIAGVIQTGIGAKSKSYGFEVSNTSRFDLASRPFSLRYGGSAKLEDAESDYRLSTDFQGFERSISPDGTRRVSTLFVNGQWNLLPWLTLDSGVTYLDYNVENRATPVWSYPGPPYAPYEGSGVSPNFGVTVTPLTGWQLFAKYTTGIRPPSLRESTWNASGLRYNPNIIAENARNWEFGTNVLKNDVFLAGDNARLKFVYFDNTTANYIGRRWNSTNPSDSYLILFNYDKVVMKGFELSGGYDVKKAFLDYAFNYYTDIELCRTAATCTSATEQADYIANQIPPRFSASATAGLRFFDEKLTIGGRYTYMGSRAASVLEDNYSKQVGIITKSWEPYSLVDAFVQWKINDSFTLDVSAENLLNRYYVDALNNTDMPAPGRTIRASLTGKFGNSAPWPAGWLFNRNPNAVPGADWTGLYVGGHVGQGFASLNGVTTLANGSANGIAAAESVDMNIKNILAGGQIGINYQFDNRLVVGIEADYSRTRLSAFREVLATETAFATRRNLASKTEYEFDWMATIRGRLGYAFDRWFVYGTGGLAFLKEKQWRDQYRSDTANSSQSIASLSFTEFAEKTRTGWTVGGGAEYAINANWSVKGEYAYTGFGEEDFLFPNARQGVSRTYSTTTICRPPVCVPPRAITTVFPGSYDAMTGRNAANAINLHTIKVGLNYRF